MAEMSTQAGKAGKKKKKKAPAHSIGIGGGVSMSEAGVQNGPQAAMYSIATQGMLTVHWANLSHICLSPFVVE